MIQQGTKSDAAKVAEAVPSVFVLSLLSTHAKSGLEGESFVPCSTDYKTVQAMVDKGVSSSSALKNMKPKVVVIPISNFASILAKGDATEVGEIRVLPTPSTLKALDQLRNSQSTSAD